MFRHEFVSRLMICMGKIKTISGPHAKMVGFGVRLVCHFAKELSFKCLLVPLLGVTSK